jgi:hypothetical protein
MTVRQNVALILNGGLNAETIMRSGEAPVDGVYYLSASLNFELSSGDQVACEFSPGPEGTTQEVGPASSHTFVSMAMNGAVPLKAGQDVTIICINGNSNGTATQTVKLAQGNLNAVLVSKSSGDVTSSDISSAARAQKSAPSLKLMKP